MPRKRREKRIDIYLLLIVVRENGHKLNGKYVAGSGEQKKSSPHQKAPEKPIIAGP